MAADTLGAFVRFTAAGCPLGTFAIAVGLGTTRGKTPSHVRPMDTVAPSAIPKLITRDNRGFNPIPLLTPGTFLALVATEGRNLCGNFPKFLPFPWERGLDRRCLIDQGHTTDFYCASVAA